MKRCDWRLMGSVAGLLLMVAAPVSAQYALSLGAGGDGVAREGTVPLSVTSDAPVEGFIAAVAFDGAKIQVTDVDRENRLMGSFAAELVVKEIFEDGFTLGVVMDVDAPFEGQTIPAGTTEICLIHVRAMAFSDAAEDVALELVDHRFGNPPLSNLLVIGGMSIGVEEGLELNAGLWRNPPRAPQRMFVENAVAQEDALSGMASIMADNSEPIEGFVISLTHQAHVTLNGFSLQGTATQAAGAEFTHEVVYPGQGGTLGVVLDFDPPYHGQTIPVTGQPVALANARLTYTGPEIPAGGSATIGLALVDSVFGTPTLQNMFVQDGLAVFPELVGGSIRFSRGMAVDTDIHFYANIDGVSISPGGCADVGYFYTSATRPIQGVSIASCFDARLTAGAMILDGSITAAVNAEFVNHHAEDGELIVGILVDSTPPVSVDRMFPPTDTPLLLCRIRFCAPETVVCGECLEIGFCDGATGAGSVPIKNRAAVLNESVPVMGHAGEVCVSAVPHFLRGDCNFDGEVDIADPAAIMSYVFLGVYHPKCLDACDANDDGVVDLADTVRVLRFLFKFGPEPPAPGPYVPGPDPTPDLYGLDLGCIGGDVCN